MRLLVVGSLHLDVVLNAPHLPALDETVTGSSVDYVFGGKGGNQATAAARMGAAVSFAGRVGSDGFGDTLRDELLGAGVETSQLQTDPGPSGMSAAIVDANGDYGAVIVSAANLRIDADRIDIPAGTAIVLLQNEVPEAVNLAVAERARAQGAKVWLNAAPARALPQRLVATVDLLIVNRVEAAYYGAEARADVLTTLGPDGVAHAGRTYPGHAVKVVSTHGAGDMFAGALAAAVAQGARIEQAIGFAQAAAALHVSCDMAGRKALTAEQVRTFAQGPGAG